MRAVTGLVDPTLDALMHMPLFSTRPVDLYVFCERCGSEMWREGCIAFIIR